MFLTVPVTPWAYSGLAMSSASAARIRACNATTAEGNNSSRSGLKSGNSPAPQRRLICTSGGAKRAAARRSAELIEERSEERRVGKGGRSGRAADERKK